MFGKVRLGIGRQKEEYNRYFPRESLERLLPRELWYSRVYDLVEAQGGKE